MPRARLLAGAAGLLAAAGLSVAVVAQEAPQSILPPGFGETPPPANSSQPASPAQRPAERSGARSLDEAVESALAELSTGEADALAAPPPPIELPAGSERDPALAGAIPPGSAGFAEGMWGTASGKLLMRLMRATDGPLASRWGHMLVRNALITAARAPSDVHPADWAAERAWLLLRIGEADAARLLVSAVDVADFSPKMTQVAAQSALANADPSGLCPLRDRLGRVERQIMPLVDAMCASLSGSSEIAASDIESARRRGRFQQIDLVLADKVVGAGADSARSVTVEWDAVDALTIWRFGLATATGMVAPERLMARARPHVLAWQARAPLLAPEARLAAARVATGLGVFSGQALVDLYAQVYDSTDPSDLAETDAWQLRLATVGNGREERVGAIRRLLAKARTPLEREATRAMLARAATRIAPDAELQDIAPDLIAAMLAAGFDRAAARWAGAVADMDDEPRLRCWAMLALAAPDALDAGDLGDFIADDDSAGKQRSGLLVAGLAGTGRLSLDQASSLSRRHGLGLTRANVWTRTIAGASERGQAGTVAVLAGVGLQAGSFDSLPAAHLYHLVAALHRNGQEFAARMIAAEALART